MLTGVTGLEGVACAVMIDGAVVAGCAEEILDNAACERAGPDEGVVGACGAAGDETATDGVGEACVGFVCAACSVGASAGSGLVADCAAFGGVACSAAV